MAATKKPSTTRANKRKASTKRKADAASGDRPAKRKRNSIVDRGLVDKVNKVVHTREQDFHDIMAASKKGEGLKRGSRSTRSKIKVDNMFDDDKDASDDEDVYEDLADYDHDDEDEEADEDDKLDEGEEGDGEEQKNDEEDGNEDESDDEEDTDDEEEINDKDVDSPLEGHIKKTRDKRESKAGFLTSSAINAATRTNPGSKKTTISKQNDQGKTSAVGTNRAVTQTARKSKKKQKSGKGSCDSGEDQTPASGSNRQSLTEPNISDRPMVRRILAQRDVAGKTFYLIDRFPSWTASSSIPPYRIMDWNAVKAEHTFQRGPDRVLKVRNPTSDDEEMLMRQLIENVMRKFGEYIYPHPSPDEDDQVTGHLIRQLFKEDEWKFSDTTANNEHLQHLQRARAEVGKTAAQTMQAAFVEALRHMYSKSQDRLTLYYGDVLIQYNGNGPTKTTKYTEGFNGHTVFSLIAPFFADMLWELNPKNTEGEHFDPLQNPVPQYLAGLKSQVGHLLSHCPYLLALPWPLAFISLFYWGGEVNDQMDSKFPFIFELLDEANETGDILDRITYTIMDDCEEERCMDEVWHTFFTAQTYIQEQADAARSAAEIAKDDAEKGAKSSAKNAAKSNARRRGGGNDGNKGGNNRRPAPAATRAKGKDDDKPKRKKCSSEIGKKVSR